ncbi:hypothetical protein J2S43_002085 [Catenuloplanes nepalensis]|uniref:Uncharacterized protein n=1 Tax=Catenuloplanes nepalensis TaxID=587533 RepID=A0ABT9MQ89_9ACTN|nr:hypothetical protein [Catenuloplanes nepalensis]MDP9793573.1 hypothetical protein [Catenuloplanes nepalensis]
MDVGQFYAAVAGINFTLLGLWWVAVTERRQLREGGPRVRRMAYTVSLQFLIPGALSLLAQVAPDIAAVWRTAFALAGALGAASILMLSPAVARENEMTRRGARLLRIFGIPLYLLIAVYALIPFQGMSLTPLQIEGIMLSLLVFLGAQTAWTVGMATPPDSPQALDDQPRVG